MRRWETYLLPLAAACFFLAAWHFGVQWSGTSIFPSPKAVLRGLGDLAHRGVLASYTRDSLFRVGSGYLLALSFGVPLGIALGWYPQLAAATNPLIQMLRPISPLAWMPLAVVWFGVSDFAPIFLIFLAAFFPVVVATMNGVRNIPPMYLQAGQNFGLAPLMIF